MINSLLDYTFRYRILNDIQGYYGIIKVTALIVEDVLVIAMTISLKDTSLLMNVYKAHNLPLVHPGLNISATYELEGEYLAVGHEGHYLCFLTR